MKTMHHKYFRGEQLEFPFIQELHPSGLTYERWHWPYKTEEERKKVVEYLAQKRKHDVRDALERLGEALL